MTDQEFHHLIEAIFVPTRPPKRPKKKKEVADGEGIPFTTDPCDPLAETVPVPGTDSIQ